ncbi:MAG: NADH-quinone oxidoreductase subunit M [Chloroflexi bacterium]|nr:NADH-quinone oxidoreductase subunit M [Chloroflexota bacterium]
MDQFPLLSTLIFLPLIGAVVALFFPRGNELWLRVWALFVSVVVFLFSVPLWFSFDAAEVGFQFVEVLPWVPEVGIDYRVGVDGISLLLVLLTTFLMPIVILSTWNSIEQRVKEFVSVALLLETAMIGTFLALDLFLFFIFWELMLVPMYFLIGVWGGPRRIYAAVKFFLYTMAGSALMLVAMMALYFLTSVPTASGHTFNLLEILRIPVPSDLQVWLFAAFAIAFAIKVPMFPFHTWLPDAHVEAPTSGSVILAAVLLKMGTYGFLRFCLPLFPQAVVAAVPLIALLSVIGIVYGALVAAMQRDVKKLVAYSSVSHLGLVMLGIFALTPIALQGSLLQMVNHGISTGALFLLVGMLYERAHTRIIDDFGGVAKLMPVFAAFFLLVMFSSVGLPGTNGFVGEFLILLGTFEAAALNLQIYAVVAASGVILGAVYLLWTYQRVMQGPVREHVGTNGHGLRLTDINAREIAVLVPLAIIILWIGFYPKPFLDRTAASLNAVGQRVAAESGRPVLAGPR